MRIKVPVGSVPDRPGHGSRQRRVAGAAELFAPRPDKPALGRATWCGISGRLYSAAVERLLFCEAPPKAAYVLVARDRKGRPKPLYAGVAVSRAPTVNLARIRQRAVALGANEVHLIDLTHSAGTYAARRLVRDVRAGIAHRH